MMRLIPLFLLTTTAALTAFPQAPPGSKNPEPDTGRADKEKDTRSATSQANHIDGLIANWLIANNENEIALAQLAQQQSTDPDMKQFAQKVIDEHSEFVQKLKPFCQDAGVGQNAVDRQGQPHQAQDASSRNEREHDGHRDAVGSARTNGEFDHIGLIEELGQQCLQTARKELEQKQGAEFDRCYMMMAVSGHSHANDMLTVFQKHVTPQFKSVLSQGQGVVEKHMQEAKDRWKKMDNRMTAAR